MKIPTPNPLDAYEQHLQQLTIIRSLLLAFLWSAFLTSYGFTNVNLPKGAVATILCVFTCINILTAFRLRNSLVIARIEFFIQLLVDIVCLIFLFYFSGGATNPFISYLLVPICISAATLPWRYTWFITILCVLAYSTLLFFHVALPIFALDHSQMHSPLNGHILGMWFNFFVSAMLITYFVVKMAKNLRDQETKLNQMREDELRNEQVLAVATLAAGTAHEINTPLATMTVLLAELRNEYQHNTQLTEDLTILAQQVASCAQSLKQMVQDASSATEGNYKEQLIKDYCNFIIDRWQLMRPNVHFSLNFLPDLTQQKIAYDTRLNHAIINLLNNAADTSPTKIIINISSKNDSFLWQIVDEGEGLTQATTHMIGNRIMSTKETGLGIGMLLSNATIKHYGGTVTQKHNSPKGTVTEIRLPLVTKTL